MTVLAPCLCLAALTTTISAIIKIAIIKTANNRVIEAPIMFELNMYIINLVLVINTKVEIIF